MKLKGKNGITLIALVITIIVLLILAGVTIAMLTGKNGIITRANQAKANSESAKIKEEEDLSKIESRMEKELGIYDSLKGIKEKTLDEVKTNKVKETVKVAVKANLESEQKKYVIVPKGYKILKAESVTDGVVITDESSEFVWIPVENINEMAKETEGTDKNDNQNYSGVLYESYSDMNELNTIIERKEPSNLVDDESVGANDSKNVKDWTETLFQEEYNEMVKSVKMYKGFYVGRYELSLDSNGNAQSKGGVKSANSSEEQTKGWYGLYNKAKTYASESDENKKVVSGMIWGSQYDTMLRWLKKNNVDMESEESSEMQNAERNTDENRITGGENNKDVINNIYDLLGNNAEWTQECEYDSHRIVRGGAYDYSDWLSSSYYFGPGSYDDDLGTRLTLYIK